MRIHALCSNNHVWVLIRYNLIALEYKSYVILIDSASFNRG